MAKKKSMLPDVGTIGIEELVPKIRSENIETVKKNVSDLSEANFALNDFNNKLMLQLAERDKEISHLKNLLINSSGIPLITSGGLVAATPELLLIEQQLKLLHADSLVRALTLDEIKRFDLLMKNKNLIQEMPTEISGQKKSPAKSKEELAQIASKRTTEEKS